MPARTRVRLVEAKRAVPLEAVDDAAAVNARRQAVVHEIAYEIGRELNGVGAREIGELKVDVGGRLLQRKHAELVFLDLGFIDQRRREIARPKAVKLRQSAGDVGDLKRWLRCRQ